MKLQTPCIGSHRVRVLPPCKTLALQRWNTPVRDSKLLLSVVTSPRVTCAPISHG